MKESLLQVYKACLDIIPHKVFTFAKVWILFAHFELRQHNLTDARKIMGVAIGKREQKRSIENESCRQVPEREAVPRLYRHGASTERV